MSIEQRCWHRTALRRLAYPISTTKICPNEWRTSTCAILRSVFSVLGNFSSMIPAHTITRVWPELAWERGGRGTTRFREGSDFEFSDHFRRKIRIFGVLVGQVSDLTGLGYSPDYGNILDALLERYKMALCVALYYKLLWYNRSLARRFNIVIVCSEISPGNIF